MPDVTSRQYLSSLAALLNGFRRPRPSAQAALALNLADGTGPPGFAVGAVVGRGVTCAPAEGGFTGTDAFFAATFAFLGATTCVGAAEAKATNGVEGVAFATFSGISSVFRRLS